MGTPKTTIELNGKQYDARTGKIIDGSNPVTATVEPKKPAPSNGVAVDGFVKRSGGNTLALAPKPKPAVSHTQAKPGVRGVQKSTTLMRPAVKKPSQIKNDIQKPNTYITKHSGVHAVRKARADASPKSPHISKFGSSATATIIKKEAHLPVVAQGLQPKALAKKANSELEKIEHALHDATSHLKQLEKDAIRKAPFLERVGLRHRFANIATITTALLLLVAFFGYQNAPAIEMRVASTRSGVDAKLPNYKPAGYGVSRGIESQSGRVSVKFVSRTDDKQFKVTQQASNWNSASLLANHVTRTRCGTCFQTWQNNGKTIYIYDNSNATWVNGGIWYQVEGNASLTSDQLLRLANSF